MEEESAYEYEYIYGLVTCEISVRSIWGPISRTVQYKLV